MWPIQFSIVSSRGDAKSRHIVRALVGQWGSLGDDSDLYGHWIDVDDTAVGRSDVGNGVGGFWDGLGGHVELPAMVVDRLMMGSEVRVKSEEDRASAGINYYM